MQACIAVATTSIATAEELSHDTNLSSISLDRQVANDVQDLMQVLLHNLAQCVHTISSLAGKQSAARPADSHAPGSSPQALALVAARSALEALQQEHVTLAEPHAHGQEVEATLERSCLRFIAYKVRNGHTHDLYLA